MKEGKIWDLPSQEKELENLEVKLQSIYQPTQPRQEYVSNLRYRLDQQLITQGVKSKPGGFKYLIIATLSVVSGTFLAVVVVRNLMAYFGRLNALTGQVEPNSIDSISPLV
jgi:hypothetical protein